MRLSGTALVILTSLSCSRGFQSATANKRKSKSVTNLSALPPPFIISPILKKMKEDEAKKKMVLANEKETKEEAPGLRVGRGAWKWPPVWPYDDRLFRPESEATEDSQQMNINTMASMLSGIAQVPTDANGESEKEQFDALQFWGELETDVASQLDPDAIEKLKQHYSFYIQDGMSILEFGAVEKTFLPDKLEPSRHVGVGPCKKLMEKNPSLTQALVVDLNKVIDGRDIDSDDVRLLSKDPFDVIIMHDVAQFLSKPREVFRTAWYLLKPGGRLIVSFSGKEFTKDRFADAQTKMWRQYNDDQHIWMTGSFFQFSAGEGWESLLGFDISPESAKSMDTGDNPLVRMMNKGKNNNIFVVQGMKGFQDETIDPENPERSIQSLCWMLTVMEQRDKTLVVPRLARAYETAETQDVRDAIERNIQYLPKIYEALVKMDQFAFSFSMQAQMAVDLVCDPDFTASDEQMLALRQGLGLRTPSKEFWAPVGQKTGAIPIEEKISLLAYIVPCFGSGDSEQEDALQAFVTGLEPTFDVIREKCPTMSESDVQLLGAELLAWEILKPGRCSRKEFAAWLDAFTGEELAELLSERKGVRAVAKEQLQNFKKARMEEEQRREEYKQKMEEQRNNARLTRTMIFNPKTEKMEIFDNPNLKKQ